jgi:hypothetical protein
MPALQEQKEKRMRSHLGTSRVRRGMAALEVVILTALTFPIAAFIFWRMVLALSSFFGMLGNSVGMPYL